MSPWFRIEEQICIGSGFRTSGGSLLSLRYFQVRHVNAGVRTARKHTRVVRVTINTRAIPDKISALNIRRRHHRPIQSGTGDEEQWNHECPGDQKTPGRHAQVLLHRTEMKDGDATASEHRHFLSEGTRAGKYGFPRLSFPPQLILASRTVSAIE